MGCNGSKNVGQKKTLVRAAKSKDAKKRRSTVHIRVGDSIRDKNLKNAGAKNIIFVGKYFVLK